MKKKDLKEILDRYLPENNDTWRVKSIKDLKEKLCEAIMKEVNKNEEKREHPETGSDGS